MRLTRVASWNFFDNDLEIHADLKMLIKFAAVMTLNEIINNKVEYMKEEVILINYLINY